MGYIFSAYLLFVKLNLTSSSFGRITSGRSSEFGGHRMSPIGLSRILTVCATITA